MATAPLPTLRAISPLKEMGAYEALWAKPGTTFTSLAVQFREHPDYLPSDFVPEHEAQYFSEIVRGMLRDAGITQFGITVHRAGEYPEKLRDAEDPVELLYYRGWWDLVTRDLVTSPLNPILMIVMRPKAHEFLSEKWVPVPTRFSRAQRVLLRTACKWLIRLAEVSDTILLIIKGLQRHRATF